jgi:hypothetical protein
MTVACARQESWRISSSALPARRVFGAISSVMAERISSTLQRIVSRQAGSSLNRDDFDTPARSLHLIGEVFSQDADSGFRPATKRPGEPGI